MTSIERLQDKSRDCIVTPPKISYFDHFSIAFEGLLVCALKQAFQKSCQKFFLYLRNIVLEYQELSPLNGSLLRSKSQDLSIVKGKEVKFTRGFYLLLSVQ